jgi:putative salt-induced outer membrane protein YdiY
MKTPFALTVSRASVLVLSGCLFLLPSAAPADTLELKNGDRFSGTVESITADKIVIATPFAGKITIERHAVLRIATDAPVKIAMANGDRVAGKLGTAPDGTVTVDTTYGKLQLTNAAAVTVAWLPTAPDPTLPPGTTWKYSLAFDLLGKSGNSRSIMLGGAADATMSGPDTDLKFYTKGAYGKTDGNVSDKRLVGGIDFERRFASIQSWYVRDEALRDDVQGIRFRNSLAGGYGYYFYKQDNRDLRVRSGVGYTYTSYLDMDRENDSSFALDFGLHYREQIGKHATWLTDITFQPSVEDFSNYFLTHESKLSIPLTIPNLSQEFGVGNQYVSQPGADKKKLDTTYFTRTRLSW